MAFLMTFMIVPIPALAEVLDAEAISNNVEKAIKVLKRKLQQEGLFREMKQRKFYEKPSVKKKRKEKEAQRRLRKKMRAMKRFN